MNVRDKLVRNGIFSGAGRLWTAATTFFIMPYMVVVLGQKTFGVFQLLLLIVTYFFYADLGISSALAKFVSEYAAKDDREALKSVINTGIAFYGSLAIVGCLISLVISNAYLEYINTPPELMREAAISFRYIIFVTGLTFAAMAFRAILAGLHRLDIINTVEVIVSVPILIATVWVLHAGYGLLGMCIVQCAQYTAIALMLVYYSVRLAPEMEFNPLRASWPVFRQLFQYWKTAASGASILFQGQTENLLLAHMLGTGAVAVYKIGYKVPDVWRSSVYPALYAIVPAASHMGAVESAERVESLYVRGTKFMVSMVYGLGMLLFIITPIFITAWMGKGWGYSMLAMRLVLIAVMCQLSAGVAISVARGLGQLKPDLVSGAVLAAAELVFGLTMGHHFGYIGILSAGVVAFALNAVTAILMIHRSFHWPLGRPLLRVYLPPLAASLLAGLPFYWYNHVRRADIIFMGSLKQRLALGLLGLTECVLYALIWVAIVWATRYITPDEIRSLTQSIKNMRKAGRDETPAPAEPAPAGAAK